MGSPGEIRALNSPYWFWAKTFYLDCVRNRQMHKFLWGHVLKHTLFIAAALATIGFSSVAHAEDHSFIIINKSDAVIAGLYVAHASTDEWSKNYAEESQMGFEDEFTTAVADERSTCTFDLKVDFDGGDTILEEGLNFCDAAEYRVSGAGYDRYIKDRLNDVKFSIMNFSEFAVDGFAVSLPGKDIWGGNFVEDEGLASQFLREVDIDDGRPQCIYDVKVDFAAIEAGAELADGSLAEEAIEAVEVVEADINLCETGEYRINNPEKKIVRPGRENDLDVKFFNTGFLDVNVFQIAPANSGVRGRNYAEGNVLTSGAEIQRFIENGAEVCFYDIVIVYADGDQMEDYGVDFCEIKEYDVSG
jgi:hypothetical protein